MNEGDVEEAHYMVYLVLQTVNNRIFDIIDDQQRMTTLSILILIAIAYLMDLSISESVDEENKRRAD